MLDLEVLSLTIRSVTLLVAATSLGVAITALRTVKEGIKAMTANAAQRTAEHDKRHTETMAAFALQRQALETLIERTAPAAD